MKKWKCSYCGEEKLEKEIDVFDPYNGLIVCNNEVCYGKWKYR
jgi:hypothetical protein